MANESTAGLREELEQLRHAYDDLCREIRELRGGQSALSRRRGVLASAGTTAESVLKFIYRREGRERGAKPSDKLMLDELITALRDVLPEHIQVPLRTLQAWRNLGAHDKGDIRQVDEGVLVQVNAAVGQVVVWFFDGYLGGEFAELARVEVPESETSETGDARGASALEAWRELYWWAMRSGQLRLLDARALDKRGRDGGLSEEALAAVKRGYARDETSLRQVITEAMEDGELEAYEVEGIEETRVMGCISEREATEVLAEALKGLRGTVPSGAPAWVIEAAERAKGQEARAAEEAETRAQREAEERAKREAEERAAAKAEPGWRAAWMSGCGTDAFGEWAETRVGSAVVKLRWCPPGRFMMGSPATEEGRFDNEGPEHEVELTRGFWLGETPVTQAQWEAVMGSNPSRFRGANRPVENVSWDDCQGFLARANGLVPGLNVRLATEAEWECACRAGSTGARYGALDGVAWYHGNAGGQTQPVKGKAANAWGLYDTLGNVWEWCADWKRAYATGRVVDPTGPSAGSVRVSRGGSWCHVAQGARAASRGALDPSGRGSHLGFRLARGQ